MLIKRGPGVFLQSLFTLLCFGCIASGTYLVRDHVDDIKVMVHQAKDPLALARRIIHR